MHVRRCALLKRIVCRRDLVPKVGEGRTWSFTYPIWMSSADLYGTHIGGKQNHLPKPSERQMLPDAGGFWKYAIQLPRTRISRLRGIKSTNWTPLHMGNPEAGGVILNQHALPPAQVWELVAHHAVGKGLSALKIAEDADLVTHTRLQAPKFGVVDALRANNRHSMGIPKMLAEHLRDAEHNAMQAQRPRCPMSNPHGTDKRVVCRV